MVLELKLRKIGNSVGVVLPKEALARLNVEEGDTVTLTDAPEGGLRVTPATAGRKQFTEQMKAAESVIRRYRNTLRELNAIALLCEGMEPLTFAALDRHVRRIGEQL